MVVEKLVANVDKPKVSCVVTDKTEKNHGKGLTTKPGDESAENTEATLIGLTVPNVVPGAGGHFKGCATETHGLELLGKIISVTYVTVEV